VPGRDAVAVLSYDYWQQRFGGDTKLIGQTLRVYDQTLTIVGIAPEGVRGLHSFVLRRHTPTLQRGRAQLSAEYAFPSRPPQETSSLQRSRAHVSAELKASEASLGGESINNLMMYLLEVRRCLIYVASFRTFCILCGMLSRRTTKNRRSERNHLIVCVDSLDRVLERLVEKSIQALALSRRPFDVEVRTRAGRGTKGFGTIRL